MPGIEVFGTVASAIGLVATAITLAAKIKTTFEQPGYNMDERIAICSDIQTSLSLIDGNLKKSSTPSDGLLQDLSNFEKKLKRILDHQSLLTKQSTDGLWDRSTSKLKDVYNAGDIKHSLTQLRQEIQTCEQNIQSSCLIRIDDGVSALRQEMMSMQRQLQMFVEGQIPRSNSIRMETLDRIEERIEDRISVMDTDGALGHELERLRTRNNSQAALSIKSAKFSLRSLSPSVMAKGYLKQTIKELARTLPRLSDHAVGPNTINQFRDPFKKLVVWDQAGAPARSRQDSILATLQILASLRSEQKILYVDAARDVLGLGRALLDLGMGEEASVMYDWGIQICQEMAGNNSPKMLFNLAQFLHKLLVDLGSRGEADIAGRVEIQVTEVRTQLGKLDRETYMAKLAASLLKLGGSVYMAGRYEDAARLHQECVTIRRELVEKNRDKYHPNLALSLFHLGHSVNSAGRYEDAARLHEESVTIRRELVEKNQDKYLPDLASSLFHCGNAFYSAGRYEECVTIRRELVEKDGDHHLPDLASSLFKLGISMFFASRYEDAVRLHQECVTIRRELVEKNRDEYLLDLESSPVRLGQSVFMAGWDKDVVRLKEERVAIRRELVEKNRDKYLLDLESSLVCLGQSVSMAGWDGEDVLRLKEERVMIWRELVEMNRDIYLDDLASSLKSLGISMYNAGRYENAVKLQQECVEIQRELVKNGTTSRSSLALSLHSLGRYVNWTGRYDDAVMFYQECVTIRRELVEEKGNTELLNLTKSLFQLGNALHLARRYEKCFTIWRELVEKNRNNYSPFLGSCLQDMEPSLRRAGRHWEADCIKAEIAKIDEVVSEAVAISSGTPF